MEDTESLQVLREIRDEMKEMNAQIKWLKNKANEAILDDEHSRKHAILATELQNKQSKNDLYAVIVIAVGLGAWFAIDKFGYLLNI